MAKSSPEGIELGEGCTLISGSFKISDKDKQPIVEIKIENKQQDVFDKINGLLEQNNLPLFGTKEYNDMCSKMFGGR